MSHVPPIRSDKSKQRLTLHNIAHATDERITEVASNIHMRIPNARDIADWLDETGRKALEELEAVPMVTPQQQRLADWLERHPDVTAEEIRLKGTHAKAATTTTVPQTDLEGDNNTNNNNNTNNLSTAWMSQLGVDRHLMPFDLASWIRSIDPRNRFDINNSEVAALEEAAHQEAASLTQHVIDTVDGDDILRRQIRQTKGLHDVASNRELIQTTMTILTSVYGRLQRSMCASLDLTLDDLMLDGSELEPEPLTQQQQQGVSMSISTTASNSNNSASVRARRRASFAYDATDLHSMSIDQVATAFDHLLHRFEAHVPTVITARREHLRVLDEEIQKAAKRNNVAEEELARYKNKESGLEAGVSAAARMELGLRLSPEQVHQILSAFYHQETRSRNLAERVRRMLLRTRLVQCLHREKARDASTAILVRRLREEIAGLKGQVVALEASRAALEDDIRMADEAAANSAGGGDGGGALHSMNRKKQDMDRIKVEALTQHRVSELETALKAAQDSYAFLEEANREMTAQRDAALKDVDALQHTIGSIQVMWDQKQSEFKKKDDEFAAALRGKRGDDRSWRAYINEIFMNLIRGFSAVAPALLSAYESTDSATTREGIVNAVHALNGVIAMCEANAIAMDSVGLVLKDIRQTLSSMTANSQQQQPFPQTDAVEHIAMRLDNAMAELRVKHHEDRYLRRTVAYFCQLCIDIVRHVREFASADVSNAFDFPPQDVVGDDAEFGYAFPEERKAMHQVLVVLQASTSSGTDKGDSANALLRNLEVVVNADKESPRITRRGVGAVNNNNININNISAAAAAPAVKPGPFPGGKYVTSEQELRKVYKVDDVPLMHPTFDKAAL
eukprot:PhM_4_TR12170/c0_g1_i1/m.106787